MAQTSMTDGVTYIVIGFITVLCILLISTMAGVVSNSEHNQVTEDSKVYMSNVALNPNSLGFNTSIYDEDIEEPIGGGSDSKYDFALEFFFGVKSAEKISKFVSASLGLPKFVISGLFRFDLNNFNWVLDLMNWLWRILIFVAIIYFIRGR